MRKILLSAVMAIVLALTSCSGGVNYEKAETLYEKFKSNPAEFTEGDAKSMLSIYEAAGDEMIKLYPEAKGTTKQWSSEANTEFNKLHSLRIDLEYVLVIELADRYPQIRETALESKKEYSQKYNEVATQY